MFWVSILYHPLFSALLWGIALLRGPVLLLENDTKTNAEANSWWKFGLDVGYDGAAASSPLRAEGRRLSSVGKWYDGPGEALLRYVCEKKLTGASCGSWGLEFQGSCYRPSQSCASYYDARFLCTQDNATLVVIQDLVKNEFVASLCEGENMCWIGLSEKPRTEHWVWSDGTSLGSKSEGWTGFNAWEKGEPNNWNGIDEESAFLSTQSGSDLCSRCWDSCNSTAKWYGFVVFGLFIIAVPLTVMIMCCVAGVYKGKVTDVRIDNTIGVQPFPSAEVIAQGPFGMADRSDFLFNLCGCFEDMDMCLHACFCFPVRFADTYASTKLSGYWGLIVLWGVAYIIGNLADLTLGYLRDSVLELNSMSDLNARSWFTGLIIASRLYRLRQNLRTALGGRADGKCCEDFLCWWCCGCCVAIQEARQVDAIQGVRVQCCFKLTPGIHPSTIVGHPAHVVGAVVVGQPVGGAVIGQIVQPTGQAFPGNVVKEA